MLVGLFVLTQVIGLGFIALEMNVQKNADGTQSVQYNEVLIGPLPDTTGAESLIFLIIGIAGGTAILLILIKFRLHWFWKLWFFLAIWMTMLITLDTVLLEWVAALLAVALAAWKVFKPNIYVHNLTEVLIYPGIAILLVPRFDVIWAAAALAIIAIYDMIAVWKSKHMIKMAEFQTESKLFAGMMINYGKPPKNAKATTRPSKKSSSQSAILGGGDISFPLIFSGTVMHFLVQEGFTKIAAYGLTLITTLGAVIGLSILFFVSKKGRFYPAMPPIVAGCLVTFLAIILVI